MTKIALLTSGGDAPGMNAAIRAVVRKGIFEGFDLYGVQRGFAGLLNNSKMDQLKIGSVADIIHRGGTILLTARAPGMLEKDNQAKAAKKLKSEGINKLIVIGGEGSFQGALTLAEYDIDVICIPGTIDNDIFGTELTIGFDTAVNTILDAINRLRDTATSHERTFVLEVMGRNNGYLALAAGLAGGAESILVPELDFDISEIYKRLKKGVERRKTHSIIIVAEGAADVYEINREISNISGLETRITVLGHIQRGGTPTAQDRLLGSRMGAVAVDLIKAGKSGLFTAFRADEIVAIPVKETIDKKKEFPEELYRLATILAR